MYHILESNDKFNLEAEVMEYIERGWKLCGGVCVVKTREFIAPEVKGERVMFYQAVSTYD